MEVRRRLLSRGPILYLSKGVALQQFAAYLNILDNAVVAHVSLRAVSRRRESIWRDAQQGPVARVGDGKGSYRNYMESAIVRSKCVGSCAYTAFGPSGISCPHHPVYC